MNTILEQFGNKINGIFSFFDRIIIKGHFRQFFSPSGKRHFLSENNILLKDFSSYANQVTSDLVSHVENMAVSENRPLLYLPSAQTSKEQAALRILKDNPVREGLICILSVVEYCQTLQPRKHDNGPLSLDLCPEVGFSVLFLCSSKTITYLLPLFKKSFYDYLFNLY